VRLASSKQVPSSKLQIVLVLALLLVLGCKEQPAFHSAFFSAVEVIGHRGAGAGELNKPRSVAVDRDDNLYVVDMTGRVQKFSPRGEFLSFWQMPQTDKGKPKGMCRDKDGNIVVLEPHYSRINHYTPAGQLVAQWGTHGTNTAELAFPRSVAVNSRGDVLVSEYGLTERVQCFSGDTKKFIRHIGKAGNGPGEFNRAEGLGIDAQDRIYVADSCNHRIQIFSPDGEFLATFGRPGAALGDFSYPYDVRIDAQGFQYVCEFGNSRIQIFDPQHRFVEMLGGPGAAPGKMSNPWAIALDSRGNLYVADAGNHRVLKFVRRQQVGRGVPAEPPPGKRQRTAALQDADAYSKAEKVPTGFGLRQSSAALACSAGLQAGNLRPIHDPRETAGLETGATP
jgi:DNA-binding beta-propeller fold protein YncE